MDILYASFAGADGGVVSMKYKFEIWKWDFFDFEGAETHLNQRAAEGWELIGVTTVWFPVAVYERTLAAASKRYAVEVSKEDDEDFFQTCEDAHWKRKTILRNGICVFETSSKDAKPLFNDKSTRYLHIAQTLEEKRPYLSMFVFVMMALYIGFEDFRTSEIDFWMYLRWFLCAGFILSAAEEYIAYRFIQRAVALAAEGQETYRSAAYKIFNNVMIMIGILTLMGMYSYMLAHYILLVPSLIGTLLVIAMPIVFLIGAWLRVIKDMVTGIVLMFLSIVLPMVAELCITGW